MDCGPCTGQHAQDSVTPQNRRFLPLDSFFLAPLYCHLLGAGRAGGHSLLEPQKLGAGGGHKRESLGERMALRPLRPSAGCPSPTRVPARGRTIRSLPHRPRERRAASGPPVPWGSLLCGVLQEPGLVAPRSLVTGAEQQMGPSTASLDS